MRTLASILAVLALLAPCACAEGEVSKETLYQQLEAEHKLYDDTVKGLQEEMKGIVMTIKGIVEPAGAPDALNVVPRTPEQEQALADAQAKAQGFVDRMLDEEFRHRRRVLELLDSGKDLLRVELTTIISQGKVPTGTLRDLLMPAGASKVDVPAMDASGKPKSLFDEKDEEDETLE
ncbi:MAG: hypothetical protein AAB434_06625 [Planctomycetota bacterium]